MIVVIEGCAGSGKSTLSAMLAVTFGWPVFRLMRNCHEALLDRVAPTNTWHQDIYATDALARVDADVIWDRSLPSGLAEVHEKALPPLHRQRLIEWWGKRLANVGGLILFMVADLEMATERHRHDYTLEFIAREQRQIQMWCEAASEHGPRLEYVDNRGSHIGLAFSQAADAIKQRWA